MAWEFAKTFRAGPRQPEGQPVTMHVDHVKERMHRGERVWNISAAPLPTTVTTPDRQADLPLAPAPPIAGIELGPEPLVEEAPPVAGLEVVPFPP